MTDDDRPRWDVLRVRRDGSLRECGAKRSEVGAVRVAEALCALSGGTYLVRDPAGAIIHTTTTKDWP